MPLLHLKCDTRVEASLVKQGVYYCPECDEEVDRDKTYRVGRRFFAGESKESRMEAKRQKRKKLFGLKNKQRRQTRQKGGK